MRQWLSQIGLVIRLEMRKTFFSRRGLWVYLLALAPILIPEVRGRGMTVFAHIDHAAGAAAAGLSLRPTEVLIFGNAKGGTPLMQAVQTIGIDLPLKALVWQDASGVTFLSYNDPAWLAKRHSASGAEAVVGNLSAALDAITKKVTSPS
jgi:uncharacterized protein (DUF302 family)